VPETKRSGFRDCFEMYGRSPGSFGIIGYFEQDEIVSIGS